MAVKAGELDKVETGSWPFDLAATLNSGQVFHWHAMGDGFAGVIGRKAVWVRQVAPGLLECTGGMAETVREYFGLGEDMAAMAATFPADDAALQRAVAWCPGLRILRQPSWECLATFITSSLKQVPHIRAISLRLRERFGELVREDGLPDQWAYPEPSVLAAAGEAALRECGLGYRAAFLVRTAETVASGAIDLGAVAAMDDEKALEALTTLHGVGDKIASCALLFGFGRTAAFPVDVWIERVMRELYFPRARKLTHERLKTFARRRFGRHCGVAQQFLFHWARLTDCGRSGGGGS